MPVLRCTTIGLEKAVFFFFLRNFVYSLFQKSGPLVFWVQKKKYSINFCDSYILKRLEQCSFFWCVNKENSLKNEVEYFLQNPCAVSSSSRSSSPSLYTRSHESRLSRFTFHLRLEIPQAEAARPITSVTWIPFPLPLILWNRSNALLSPHCQPSRHFVFKDKLRSKNAGKVKVLICWHHVTLSVDRSKFCWSQTFKIWLKSQTFKIWLKLPEKVPPSL